MIEKLKAIYRDGIFIPEVICDFPQNTIVELTIRSSRNFKTEVIDPEARQQIMKTLLERMRQTSLGSHSRRLTCEKTNRLSKGILNLEANADN